MIVATCGQKGGSGKTTTAIAIADEWHYRGRDVLLLDADPQGTAVTWRDIAKKRGREGPTVAALDVNFHEQIDGVRNEYDRVVIDCPPGDAAHDRTPDGVVPIQRSALFVADLALVPCGPGVHDVWSVNKTVDLIREAQSARDGLLGRLVLTRLDTRTVISRKARKALDETDLPLLRSALGSRVAYQEMPSSGVGVTRYQPKSKAAGEVRALVNELESLEAAR